ncbi:MAG: S6e family ribosomal protein [Candidatus Njordarchaeales archaeon]
MSSRKTHPLQLVINDSSTFLGTGISVKFEIEDENVKTFFYSKRVGDIIEGDSIGFPGYKFQIRGGSDIAGFPHLKGIPGTGLKQVLKSGPPGYRPRKYKVEKKTGGYKIINLKGVKKKKTVRGEELSEWTRQVNMVILERGGRAVHELNENEMLNDHILDQLCFRLGKTVLKWGLEGVVIISDGSEETLEKVLENYNIRQDSDFFIKLAKKLGVRLVKLGKENLKRVFEPLRKVSRKHPHPLGRYIAWTLYNFYNALKENKIDLSKEDEVTEDLVNKIMQGVNDWLSGKMKRGPKFSFRIVETPQ